MEAREILKGIAPKIAGTATGVERQRLVGRLVDELSDAQRACLRQVVDGLLGQMGARNASDLDMGGAGCQGRVWYRIHGQKKPDDSTGPFAEDETDVLLHNLLTEGQREYLFAHRNLDFSYAVAWNGQAQRYRADMYFELDHLALNARHIVEEVRSFKSLAFHPNVVKTLMVAYEKQGLVLVTGITGSGKSSTLDSIIDANNQTAHAHIAIIGAPIEQLHPSKQSIVRHREVGRDVPTFKDGAVQALRQDPDIVVIGEMRDRETIVATLELADSGHKVFTTLHTASAVESLDRIVAESPPEEQNRVRERLADVLKCIISQKLVPSLDGRRALAKEILLMTPSVKAAIKNNSTDEIYQMMHEGQSLGMHTLEQDLKRLVITGRISSKEALAFANNKRRMESLS